MKHSYLYDDFFGTNNNLKHWDHKNGCLSWHILEFNLAEPLTPSVIIKRYIHET